MEPSSSFVQHHEFLNVFLQPFSFNLKAKTPCRRELKKSGGNTKASTFGIKKLWRKTIFFVGFGCFLQPGESRVVSELCFHYPAESSQERHGDANPFSRSGETSAGCVWAFKHRETCARDGESICKDKVGLPQHANLRQSIHGEGLQKCSKEIESLGGTNRKLSKSQCMDLVIVYVNNYDSSSASRTT